MLKNLKLIELRVDDRRISFQSGVNVIVGANGTGKTTIFNCIRYALGLAVEPLPPNIHTVELLLHIGANEFVFTRRNGERHLSVGGVEWEAPVEARSAELDQLLLRTFTPAFSIGAYRASMFPILDFSFMTESAPLNSRNLWQGIRLICGANDQLLAEATGDTRTLRKKIELDELFLSRNDDFVTELMNGADDLNPENRLYLANCIETARRKISTPIEERREILSASIARIHQLDEQNEIVFSRAFEGVEFQFLRLAETFSSGRYQGVKAKDAVFRKAGSLSYGETVFANFLVLMAIVAESNDSDLNFPNFYVNDCLGSRSSDEHTMDKISKVLGLQTRIDSEFQYIEFASCNRLTEDVVVAELDGRRWAL